MQLTAQARHYRAAYPHASHDLVVVDGQAVGQLRVARDAHAIHLVDIALLPAARGRGTGTLVITALMDEARAGGLPLTVAVFPDSRSRGLYQRLGFTETAGEGGQITMRWS
jgi:GNAT superfamily N-acetyltransferase